MSGKRVSILLYRPDGGTVREYSDVEITSQSPEEVTFKTKQELVVEKEMVTTTYTTNLKYLIVEEFTHSGAISI